MITDKTKRNTYIDASKLKGESLDKILGSINSNSFSNKEKENFEAFKEDWESYKKDGAELIKGVVNNDAALILKARLSAAENYDNAYEHLQKLINSNMDTAQIIKEENSSHASSTKIEMLALIFIGIFSAILLGIFISRIIGKPIKNLTDLAMKLSDGDVNISVESSAKDEIGVLTNSFKKMIENIKTQARLQIKFLKVIYS